MVHYLDDMDSKLQGVLDLAEKENTESPWTHFNRLFGRPMYKSSLPDMEASLKWGASPPSSAENQPKISVPQRKPRPHEPLTTSLADQLKKTLGDKS
jgi:hypothetical protein